MDKIMVGDIVKVNPNNAGNSYPLYFDWFTFYKVREEKYEPDLPRLKEHINVYNEEYIVRWIAPHLRYDEMLYAIMKKVATAAQKSSAHSREIHLKRLSEIAVPKVH